MKSKNKNLNKNPQNLQHPSSKPAATVQFIPKISHKIHLRLTLQHFLHIPVTVAPLLLPFLLVLLPHLFSLPRSLFFF